MNHSLKSLLILLLTLSQWTHAQTGKLEIGIEGGINWSNSGKERFKSDFKSMTYGSGGISLHYHFSRFFALKTGLNYEARGFEYPMTFTYPDHVEYPWFTTRFDFLTIPLLARLTVGKKVLFFLNAGGYFGTALDKRGHLEGDEPGFNQLHLTYLDNYKKQDYGFLAGIGLGVPLNETWMLSLEARGAFGFADATEDIITKRWETTNVLLGVNYRVKPRDPENPSIQNNRISIGIRGGLNCTFARGQKAPDPAHYNYRTYPNAGYSYELAIQWNFKKLVSIQSGILYEQKSVVSNTHYTSPGYEQIIHTHLVSTFNYLTIPVMAKLNFGKKVQFFLNTGFFISILNKQNDRFDRDFFSYWSGSMFVNSKVSEDNRSMYKKVDAGLSGGLGMDIPIKKRFSLSVEWRHNYGMRNLFNTDNWKGEYTGIKSGSFLTHSMGFLVGISHKLAFREAKNK